MIWSDYEQMNRATSNLDTNQQKSNEIVVAMHSDLNRFTLMNAKVKIDF